ncbi:unnamed protein product [Danaus chrysippus]|uniref:(African queen) hypothetical protein n=1 Tax=Danaus chrysippus TaxID=151541 RepID=A0A8J2QC33_9NEOP|nr:unnamed protein product [Danaus chrysippus]
MKLSVSAYRAHAAAHKKILTSSYQQHYGSTAAPSCNPLQPSSFTPQTFRSYRRRNMCRHRVLSRLHDLRAWADTSGIMEMEDAAEITSNTRAITLVI